MSKIWAETITLTAFEPYCSDREVCGIAKKFAMTKFEGFLLKHHLTSQRLKSYIYSRSAPLNLENQIQQGF
jgi:hypothetical protein